MQWRRDQLWQTGLARVVEELAQPRGNRSHDLEEIRESRDYWHSRARTLPRRRIAARREAAEYARRWDERLDDVARGALLTHPVPAVRALLDVRRARVARRARRLATLGLGAMFALAAGAVAALDIAWHALRALLG